MAAGLASAYLIVGPTGADLPAQLLRVRLFSAEGFGLWNNWWYGGHYVAGYSVLFPPLAWLLSPQLIAAAASVGTAAAFEALAHDSFGEDAWIGSTWLGAGTVTELLSGRLTFALGLCGSAVTALLLVRRRAGGPIPAFAALLTALASPVAGLFAALAGATAMIREASKPRLHYGAGAITLIAALTPLVVSGIVFPEGGYEPFAFSTLWPLLAIGAAMAVAAQRSGHTTLLVAIALYGIGMLFAYLIPTPVGANAARLGQLAAGPVTALLLVPRRAWLTLALASLPLAYLQVHDATVDLRHGEPDNTAAYYRPVIGYLKRQPGIWRVEVPFTQGHWEAYWLAPLFPLARGWERQPDIAHNTLFYRGRLTAERYQAWLHALAVRYVAVADAAPDYSARAELRLIRRGLPYLRVAARLRHWTVYRVAEATPIASGAARLERIGSSSLTLAVEHPGSAYVRVRWAPYWLLSGVHGCVQPAGDFTRIVARDSGQASLRMAFSLTRVGSRTPRCG